MTTPTITDEQIAKIEALAKESFGVGEEWLGYYDIASALTHEHDIYFVCAASPEFILALISRLRAAERDAARYRWLRDETSAFADFLALDEIEGEWRRVSISDYAVDTAMSQP